MEGDAVDFAYVSNGGFAFLSTPSEWRATMVRRILGDGGGFLSTPSEWRATMGAFLLL